MLPQTPPPALATDLVMTGLYIAASLAMSLYLYVTFLAPRLRQRTRPDHDALTEELLDRHRAHERREGPAYLLPGEGLDAEADPGATTRAEPPAYGSSS